MSAPTEEMIALLEAEIKALKEEKRFEKLLEIGTMGHELYEKIFERTRIKSGKAKVKYEQAKKDSKLTPAIIEQYYLALESEKASILSVVQSNTDFFSKFNPQQEAAQKKSKKPPMGSGQEQLPKIPVVHEMAEKRALEEKEVEMPLTVESQPKATETVPVSSPDAEALAQPEALSTPQGGPSPLDSEGAIAALKKEIKEFELTIKVRLSSYNPALELSYDQGVKSMLEYSTLSEKSRSQKALIEQSLDQKATIELYETYKNALEKEREAIDAIIERQQSNPNAAVTIKTNNDNIVVRILKTTGSLISNSLVGRGFKAIGKAISGGFKALGKVFAKRVEDSTDQLLPPPNVELTKKVSNLHVEMKHISEQRDPESPAALHENTTLFSDVLSPLSEFPSVDKEAPSLSKEALVQQKHELDELRGAFDLLEFQFFDEDFPELKNKLEKPERHFEEIQKNHLKKKHAYEALIGNYATVTGEKDLQKIYDAGLEYKKALDVIMAKERQYLPVEKPGYKAF